MVCMFIAGIKEIRLQRQQMINPRLAVGSAEKPEIFDVTVFRARPNVPTFGTDAASSKSYKNHRFLTFRDWQKSNQLL